MRKITKILAAVLSCAMIGGHACGVRRRDGRVRFVLGGTAFAVDAGRRSITPSLSTRTEAN